MAVIEKDRTTFPIGEIVFSSKVSQMIVQDETFALIVMNCIMRHSQGDWGSIGPQDRESNNIALQTGLRLLSAYPLSAGMGQNFIWIITAADREQSKVVFRDEYS